MSKAKTTIQKRTHILRRFIFLCFIFFFSNKLHVFAWNGFQFRSTEEAARAICNQIILYITQLDNFNVVLSQLITSTVGWYRVSSLKSQVSSVCARLRLNGEKKTTTRRRRKRKNCKLNPYHFTKLITKVWILNCVAPNVFVKVSAFRGAQLFICFPPAVIRWQRII